MKHRLISLLFLSASFHVVAQETLQTITDNGNHTHNRIIINRTSQAGSRITAYGYNLGYFDVFNNNNNSISLNLLRSDGAHVFGIDGHSMDSYFGGKLGLGTAAPLAKLDIRDGHVLLKNLTNTNGESVPMIMQSLNFGNYTTCGTSINSFTESGSYNSYALQFFTQDTYATGLTEKLRISANGNVGVGTATPKEKLSVNGKIRAKEIKVETANWPDYVFEEGYSPKLLQEIDEFIKLNKHLPEVPSAKEVAENGIELGEMNKILLKKIEELTLLLIKQDKDKIQQEAQIKDLLIRVKQLEKNKLR